MTNGQFETGCQGRSNQVAVQGRERRADSFREKEVSGVVGRQPMAPSGCQQCGHIGERLIDADWQLHEDIAVGGGVSRKS